MASVLVTGGAGFIGSHLVDRLLSLGHSVVVVDDLSSGKRGHLPSHDSRLTFIEASLLDVDQWASALEGVSAVFHLAALISGYESLEDPEAYLSTNVTGLVRLLRALRGKCRPRLVFASSSGVYGNAPNKVRRETDLPAPATVYALSKLTGEHLLDMYRDSVGYDDVSFRLFNVYGPRQNRHHPYANVTCKFSHAAATGAPVVLYGDGSQSRDFVYVDDVIRVFVAAMDRSTPRRVYNVGTGQDASIGGLLELVQTLAGCRLEVERRGPWPNDIQAIVADVSRLRSELDVVPEVSLREGLTQTIGYFRSEQPDR